MKIAIVTDHVPTQYAHSINTMKHAQGFFSLGHEVEILIIQRYLELRNKIKLRNVHEFYDISLKIKIKYFTDKSPLFFREYSSLMQIAYLLSRKLRKKFPKIAVILEPEKNTSDYCKKKEFDLVYCRRSYNVAYHNFINKIPTIIELHDYYYPPQLKRLLKLRKNKYFKGIVTLNKTLKKNFLKQSIPTNKIIALEDAVNLENFDLISNDKTVLRKALNFPLKKKIIVYTGNLSEGRGIDTIINSMTYLRGKNMAFYIIGGNTDEIKYWKKFIEDKGIKEDISFLGFKKNNLIPLYLKSADILLAPYSLRCSTVKWMSPIKLFEYMASRVPMIASDVERIKEICDNGECLFFKTDDPLDLSEKIEILMLNKKLQDKLIQNAYNKVKSYTYKKRCEIILKKFGGYENKNI